MKWKLTLWTEKGVLPQCASCSINAAVDCKVSTAIKSNLEGSINQV